MSPLVKVVPLSVTVACTVGLEPLMFPTGPTEVMVTPLEPPRLAPPLAPDLVLGLALPEVLRLLDLPTFALPSLTVAFGSLVSHRPETRPDPQNGQVSQPASIRPLGVWNGLLWPRKPLRPAGPLWLGRPLQFRSLLRRIRSRTTGSAGMRLRIR